LNEEAESLWARATKTVQTASLVVESDPDFSVSRAYAAFYALSALFALENRTFQKHREIEAAVHRDLVKSGRIGKAIGKAFSELSKLRAIGDYGVEEHVTVESAKEALRKASMVIDAARNASPEPLP
jgi:uncharacterized protein (UPF0332 family)